MKKPQSDELHPRHVRALSQAVKETLHIDKNLGGTFAPGTAESRHLKQAMKIVRELAAQHAGNRRRRNW